LGLRAESFAFGASEKPTNEIQQALSMELEPNDLLLAVAGVSLDYSPISVIDIMPITMDMGA
jgi:hypothetical protein